MDSIMQIFKDANGRPWELHIDVTVRDRVLASMQLDLFGLILDKLQPLGELLAEPRRFVELLWLLCEAQAGRLNVSPEDFGRALYGDALGEAVDRFTDALFDFFPPRQRQAMQRALAANRATGAAILEEALKELEGMDPQEQARKIVQELKTRSSRPAKSKK